ncbi:MAG: right-handed parallel beta-helix repeat-containing protein [Ferruginibacter sp.]
MLNYFIKCIKTGLVILLSSAQVHATNYYISAAGNDNADGTSPVSAWKSIDKLNHSFYRIEAGDSILFRRGDVFYGSIVVKKQGTKNNSIVISAYGNGAQPVITGFTTLQHWQTKANGIWEADAPGASPAVNLVVKDGLIQQVGRYPNRSESNGGYLVYNAVDGPVKNTATASVTSASAITKNWTGAEVVIRKRRWNIERDTVVGQEGNKVLYRQPYKGNVYPGVENFGFFFQRHPATLDQDGEWYFDPVSKKLQLYLGVISPFSSSIKISTIDTLIDIGNHANIVIADLSFEGANEVAVYSEFTSGCTVSNCNFNLMGREAVTLWQTSEALVEYCNVNNVLGSGIFIRNSGSGGYNNATVQYCNVKNVCLFPGMEISGDATGRTGITVVGGSNVTIQYNTVDSAGYAGIEWQGNDVLVYSNVITNCLSVRDDGGAIYSYVGKGPTPKQYRNRIIRKNIILNCTGASEGTNTKKSSARGIYCDEGSNHILIDSNTVADCSGSGLYLNSCADIMIRKNTVYNNGQAISIQRFQNAPSVRNITVKRNWFFPYAASYANSQIDNPPLTLEEDMKALGSIDSNYYSAPQADALSFATTKTGSKEYRALTKPMNYWKTDIGFDKNSAEAAAANTKVKLIYNTTAQPKVVNLNGSYKDPEGNVYATQVILQPFRSLVLIGGR